MMAKLTIDGEQAIVVNVFYGDVSVAMCCSL
jgi:hypothetical protein